MSILGDILSGESRGAITPSSFGAPVSDAYAAGNHSGVHISDSTAMTISSVWGCVRVLSEPQGMFPAGVYQKEGRGRTALPEYPGAALMTGEINPLMNASSAREYLVASAVLTGNGYAAILRDSSGDPAEIWPLPPRYVTPRCRGRSVSYWTWSDWFGERVFQPADMIHLTGPTKNGLLGLSPIAAFRQAMGLSKAAEEFGARLFGQGVRQSGVVRHPHELSPEAYERLKQSITEANAGLRNSHGVLILEDGSEWTQLTINPDDAQFLETRKFQVAEIARVFRVPPHLIADLERATFSNIEHQSLDFVVHSLLPWLVRLEREFNRKLVRPVDRRRVFWKHSVDALLRGDIKTRYVSYGVGRQWGWLSANDVRELEDMNPIEGGDVYLSPSNMQPVDALEMASKDVDPADRDEFEAARMLRGLVRYQYQEAA